jgi:hypothetical protein
MTTEARHVGGKASKMETGTELMIKVVPTIQTFQNVYLADISPANPAVFNRLQSIADVWEYYEVEEIEWTHVPNVSTAHDGSVWMYWDPDPSDTVNMTEQQVINNRRSVGGELYRKHTMKINRSDLPNNRFYIREGTPTTLVAQSRQESVGQIAIFTSNIASSDIGATLGYIWVSYKIRFHEARPPMPITITSVPAAQNTFSGANTVWVVPQTPQTMKGFSIDSTGVTTSPGSIALSVAGAPPPGSYYTIQVPTGTYIVGYTFQASAVSLAGTFTISTRAVSAGPGVLSTLQSSVVTGGTISSYASYTFTTPTWLAFAGFLSSSGSPTVTVSNFQTMVCALSPNNTFNRSNLKGSKSIPIDHVDLPSHLYTAPLPKNAKCRIVIYEYYVDDQKTPEPEMEVLKRRLAMLEQHYHQDESKSGVSIVELNDVP